MAKRMTIMVLILALVFGGIFWFLGYFKPKMINQYFDSFVPPPTAVSTADVVQAQWTPFFDAIGNVEATQQISVTSEVAGIVKEIAFDSGNAVRKGALLIQLDTEVDMADLRGLEASAELARANFRRDQQLLERRVASSIDFETSRAQLRSAEARVESQKAQIGKKRIEAPFDGVLGLRKVSLGEYVRAGDPIVTLQTLNTVYVNFTLPEQAFAAVREGLTVEARLSAWPDKIFTGKVTAIDPRIDAQTRNFTVQATFANPELALRPGMFADVRLLTAAQRDLLTVPEAAIDPKLYGTSVFVIKTTDQKDEQGEPILTVERRYVETGLTLNHQVEITRGLNAGEQVVTAGQLKLQNGSRVIINNAAQLN